MTEPTRELTQADADKLAETILQLPREQFFRKEIRAIIWQAAREAPPATGEGWISVSERLPELGEWDFTDELAPDDGSRVSKCHIVFADGEITWAQYAENTEDHGKTIGGECYWIQQNALLDYHHELEGVTHWMSLPDPPKEGK
jgi:hypothetical protein